MKENKIYQPEQQPVRRSQVRLAEYNPRKITDEARKKLKRNMTEVGLLGGIVWNRRTGNIVSGHQRVAIMDGVNRYDPADPGKNDYEFRVEVVDLDPKAEKEQNLFMNNRAVQGTYDDDLLRQLLSEHDVDYEAAGFDAFDVEMLGLSSFGGYEAEEELPQAPPEPEHGAWTKERAVGESEALAAHDAGTKSAQENTRLDRSVGFYADTEANQIARHNEVQKIKDRIGRQNDFNKDGGMLSYFVASFKSPTEKMNFMASLGLDPEAKYVNGDDLARAIEFADEE